MYGLLKEKVFTEKPRSLEHLKELIEGHFNSLLTLQLYKKVQISVEKVPKLYSQ